MRNTFCRPPRPIASLRSARAALIAPCLASLFSLVGCAGEGDAAGSSARSSCDRALAHASACVEGAEAAALTSELFGADRSCNEQSAAQILATPCGGAASGKNDLWWNSDRPSCDEVPLGEEYIRPGEQEDFERHAERVGELIGSIAERGLNGDNRARRGAHAKPIACVRATYEPAESVPESIQVGPLLSQGKAMPAWIRWSTFPSSKKSDSAPLGLGLKILEPSGAWTQNFTFMSVDSAPMRDGDEFMDFAVAAMKESKLAMLGYLIGHPRVAANLLRGGIGSVAPSVRLQPFYSAAPMKLGDDRAMKLVLKPCEKNEQADSPGGPDALRDELRASLPDQGACYEVYAQPQVDSCLTPTEDLSVAWDEEIAPLTRIGTLRVEPKDLDAGATQREEAFCEDLNFGPWIGLPEYRPLGHANRLRAHVYQMSSSLRGASEEPAPGDVGDASR